MNRLSCITLTLLLSGAVQAQLVPVVFDAAENRMGTLVSTNNVPFSEIIIAADDGLLIKVGSTGALTDASTSDRIYTDSSCRGDFYINVNGNTGRLLLEDFTSPGLGTVQQLYFIDPLARRYTVDGSVSPIPPYSDFEPYWMIDANSGFCLQQLGTSQITVVRLSGTEVDYRSYRMETPQGWASGRVEIRMVQATETMFCNGFESCPVQ
jgi:hypothetical protein